MAWVVTAIVTTVASSLVQADATRQAAKEFATAADAEQDAYRKGQELLQKNKDEAITDIEAASLRAQGLITDGMEASITSLNATEQGAIATLQEFTEKSDQLFASTEELVIKDLKDSGFISRQDITESSQEAIETIAGFNQEAIDALTPFVEAGQRGLEREQFLTGLLTEEEKEAHVAKFGEIEGSPIFQFQKKALRDRQKALGRVFSGRGELEEVGVAAQEAERQFQRAQGIATRGFQASQGVAGIQQGTGQQIAGIQQARGINLANQATVQGQQISNIRRDVGIGRINLQSQLGTNISNLQLNLGQARATVRSNAALNQARLAEGLGTGQANIRTGQTAQQVNLLTTAAQRQSQSSANIAELNRQATLAPFQGLVSGLGSAAQISGFQQGINNPFQLKQNEGVA